MKKLTLILLFILISATLYGQSSRGIDVSRYQKSISWSKVKAANVGFVYIKATEGSTLKDSRFESNFSGAKSAGLEVGVYHFFRMTSSPYKQFENFKRAIGSKKMDLIPMVDVEVRDGHSKASLQKNLDIFISLIKQHYGCVPMIYSSQVFYNKYLAPKYNRYHLYLGRYNKIPPTITGKGTYTIWQYTESGKINGISTAVDICRFHPNHNLNSIRLKKRS